MSDVLSLDARWARRPLPAGTQQVAYALIEAQTQAQVVTTTTPLTFCMVLDRSGSMDGPKIENLKRAVMDVITTLQPGDHVAVIVFDETADVVVPLQPVSDKAALHNRVEAIRVQGGTAMSSGLEAAAAELQRATSDNIHLLLLTDGQTWGDEDRCREIAAQLGQRNVRITALGLGDEWNERLLDDLARATGGESDYIAKPQDLVASFHRVAQTAHAVTARNAQLLVRLAEGVQPRAIYRVTPQIANLGYKPLGEREISVALGDVAANVGASVLIELMLPPLNEGAHRVAQAEVTFIDPDGNPGRVRSDLQVEVTGDANAVQVDPRIMNTVEKVTAFKLQTRALDEAALGNSAGATQKLRSAATRLLNLGESELATTVECAANAIESGQTPSAADQKEITYSTRRLSLKDLQTEK